MKLGVTGTGMIAKEALPVLRKLGMDIVALCGTPRSAETVRELCVRYRIPKGTADFAELLSDAEVDTVYLAVPNSLHFSMAKQALNAGKHVILEKPLTDNVRDATELAELSRTRGRLLFEAVTTRLHPNYQAVRDFLPEIGTVKLVQCNFSQYSSRYDAFARGETPVSFDPAKSGGALMDLNLYNFHYIVGLFGKPRSVTYRANIERGIDTSGAALLDYGAFQAVSVAAKDSASPCHCVIQGVKGCIVQDTPANLCGPVTLRLNGGEEKFRNDFHGHRMEPEFERFARAIDGGDRAFCDTLLQQSVTVAGLLTDARKQAGIRFPSDDA
ncbi:MAG: Gfo/Idh/MocA family oxidoreductase [Oscillibacter sp.]|nr:Gfo/Idh/MocA family oxidoreductase [Oscillibacter sp.]